MSIAKIVSLLLIVPSALGCSSDAAEPGEPLGSASAAQIKDGWLNCIRDRSDLPGGHNIDSWILACVGAGGTVSCDGDMLGSTPLCCKEQGDGSRECSDDPGDLTRPQGALEGGSAPGTLTQGTQPKRAQLSDARPSALQ
jgi:hypothetical protein